MLNRSLPTISAVLFAAILAGCGDDDHNTQSTATATATAVQAATNTAAQTAVSASTQARRARISSSAR